MWLDWLKKNFCELFSWEIICRQRTCSLAREWSDKKHKPEGNQSSEGLLDRVGTALNLAGLWMKGTGWEITVSNWAYSGTVFLPSVQASAFFRPPWQFERHKKGYRDAGTQRTLQVRLGLKWGKQKILPVILACSTLPYPTLSLFVCLFTQVLTLTVPQLTPWTRLGLEFTEFSLPWLPGIGIGGVRNYIRASHRLLLQIEVNTFQILLIWGKTWLFRFTTIKVGPRKVLNSFVSLVFKLPCSSGAKALSDRNLVLRRH